MALDESRNVDTEALPLATTCQRRPADATSGGRSSRSRLRGPTLCPPQSGRSGEERQRVSFPAKKVSSIAFGGPDYADAYVTTAGGQDRANEGPGAGALFRVPLGVQGVPEYRSRIGL